MIENSATKVTLHFDMVGYFFQVLLSVVYSDFTQGTSKLVLQQLFLSALISSALPGKCLLVKTT